MRPRLAASPAPAAIFIFLSSVFALVLERRRSQAFGRHSWSTLSHRVSRAAPEKLQASLHQALYFVAMQLSASAWHHAPACSGTGTCEGCTPSLRTRRRCCQGTVRHGMWLQIAGPSDCCSLFSCPTVRQPAVLQLQPAAATQAQIFCRTIRYRID